MESPRPVEGPAEGRAEGPSAATRPAPESHARRRLRRALLTPRLTATHLVAAVLCAVLGFAVVAQVRQTQGDALSGMRQDDLVRLLDELGRRNGELAEEQDELRGDLAELRSASSSLEAAREAAAEAEQVQGVLAGVLPVRGPGVVLRIADPDRGVSAQQLVTILEELRNSGAESIELSGQRLAAASWIVDGPEGVIVDGAPVSPPYIWIAVGDPGTMAGALAIPGGALATVRNAGATAEVEEVEEVEITAVRSLTEAEYASPVPPAEPG